MLRLWIVPDWFKVVCCASRELAAFEISVSKILVSPMLIVAPAAGVFIAVGVVVGVPGVTVMDVGVLAGTDPCVPMRTATSVVRLDTFRIRSPAAFVEIACELDTLPAYVSHHSTLNDVLAANPLIVKVPLIGAIVPVLVQI